MASGGQGSLHATHRMTKLLAFGLPPGSIGVGRLRVDRAKHISEHLVLSRIVQRLCSETFRRAKSVEGMQAAEALGRL